MLPGRRHDDLGLHQGGAPRARRRGGQPTRVEVALELPAMEIQTRAMMSEKDDSQVNTLWVGTFLASTGVKSGSAFSEVNRSDQHVFHTLTLDTKSGPSRIAGVANVDDNYGTTDNEMIDGSPSSDEMTAGSA